MIYFDNAATSFPKPPQVAEAMSRFLAEDSANPGRAGHRMAVRAEQMLDQVRLKLTRLVNGADPRRMIFALNGTDALNMAIKGVLAVDGTEHVITTVLEHNSVSRPLEAMAAAGGIALTRINCDGEGFVDPDDVRRAIEPSTRLIAMTHASNVLGTIQDAAAVGAIAREHGLLFCLDAAQTAGVLPIDVDAMQVDLLAFPGHKSLLGPTGTGALYVGERCPAPAETGGNGLRPWREGGTGGDSASATQPTLYPYFLEGGTPNTVGIAGLGAGIDYLLELGSSAVLDGERRIVQTIANRLRDDERFVVHGPRKAERRVATLSIGIAGSEAEDVAAILDDSFDIAVRAGLHCAPYCHRRLGTFPSGTVRISVGPFNTDEDLAALLHALDQVAAA
jgi:cysteine desulfurase / selenocysteine lyase